MVSISRIQNGLLAERWDVIQDEATREASKSRLPMYEASFRTERMESRVRHAKGLGLAVDPGMRVTM